MTQITDSVGADGANETADVRAVQALLNRSRGQIPDMREIREDGICGPKTLAAIRAFQGEVLKFRTIDGVVDPEGKTWKALVAGPKSGPSQAPPAAPMEGPSLEYAISFPLKNRNVPSYQVPRNLHEHHRYFGARRKDKAGNYRAHAACDLIAAHGTPVLAIDDGTVVLHEPRFFEATDALVIRHANGLTVRYGEIKAYPGIARAKTGVSAGQVVGYVEKNSKGTAMLHIEMYASTESGRLSVQGNVFRRRGDLVNPTRYLDEADDAA